MRKEIEKRKGKITQNDGTEVEVDLVIERTYHEDGRKDVNVHVPGFDMGGDAPSPKPGG